MVKPEESLTETWQLPSSGSPQTTYSRPLSARSLGYLTDLQPESQVQGVRIRVGRCLGKVLRIVRHQNG